MNVELLNHNKSDNNCNNLEIISSALMDFDGYKDIFIPYCSDNTSFDESVAISNMTKKDFIVENVKCEKFDTWLSLNNISNVGFIKMDVQGFEYNVLKGMNKFLEDCNDLYILIEWDENHTIKSGNSLDKMYEFLTSKGFKEFDSFPNDKLFYKN
jgi:FkbM family methyltransferase